MIGILEVQECRSDAALRSVDKCAACIYLERRGAETQRFSLIEHRLHGGISEE